MERTAKDLEEKMLMASMKNNQLSKVNSPDWKCFCFSGRSLESTLKAFFIFVIATVDWYNITCDQALLFLQRNFV